MKKVRDIAFHCIQTYEHTHYSTQKHTYQLYLPLLWDRFSLFLTLFFLLSLTFPFPKYLTLSLTVFFFHSLIHSFSLCLSFCQVQQWWDSVLQTPPNSRGVPEYKYIIWICRDNAPWTDMKNIRKTFLVQLLHSMEWGYEIKLQQAILILNWIEWVCI